MAELLATRTSKPCWALDCHGNSIPSNQTKTFVSYITGRTRAWKQADSYSEELPLATRIGQWLLLVGLNGNPGRRRDELWKWAGRLRRSFNVPVCNHPDRALLSRCQSTQPQPRTLTTWLAVVRSSQKLHRRHSWTLASLFAAVLHLMMQGTYDEALSSPLQQKKWSKQGEAEPVANQKPVSSHPSSPPPPPHTHTHLIVPTWLSSNAYSITFYHCLALRKANCIGSHEAWSSGYRSGTRRWLGKDTCLFTIIQRGEEKRNRERESQTPARQWKSNRDKEKRSILLFPDLLSWNETIFRPHSERESSWVWPIRARLTIGLVQ